MKQFSTIAEMKAILSKSRAKGKTIGFVPTMGALHDGHLRLVQRARQENDLTVASIFVNPTQFNNKEDLVKYPRTLAHDARLLEDNGCDFLFAPDVPEMYPHGQEDLLKLDFGLLGMVMEGKFRPGHFQGVATIVHKLFALVDPTTAYFGKKDYQQLAVIRNMVSQLNLPVNIIGCETVRESDGLAMSSRNMRLTIAERQLAPAIYQILQQVKQRTGKRPVKETKSWVARQFEKLPGFQLEYFEIGDKDSLQPLENWKTRGQAVAFIAVYLGDVRLIDNLELFS